MIGLIVVIEACFICPRKIEGRYTELRLDTEEKTGKKIGELPAPVYISKKRMTNGKLNSPQNISPKNKNISNSEQKSIPLYLYDIFETKLSMEYPEEYLKNKMYRDAVQSGDIEKAKKYFYRKLKLMVTTLSQKTWKKYLKSLMTKTDI